MSTTRDLPSIQDAFEEEDKTDTIQIPREAIVSRPPPKSRRGALVMLRGMETGRMFLLAQGETTVIGRARDAHVRFEDKGLSRQHARIVREGDRHFVEDLGSHNGTFVNGARVTRAELHDGVRIALSPSVVLRFNLVDDDDERVTKQLFEASTRDALTNIYNRRYFDERLAAEVAYAHRHEGLLGLVMIDVDHFKQVNDKRGHLAGDTVLQAVARRISTLIRAEDVFARYGGEEFVIIARGVPVDGLKVLAERVRRVVQDTSIHYESDPLRVTVSAGVATLNECDAHATGDLLVALADERLYRAKHAGRNCVCTE